MDLQTTWFVLIGVLIAGYAILDGFDLGVGVLSLFGRSDEERRLHLNAIGPVWDGNEVWLLTGGGALFAAFPAVYATVFSAFYLPFILLLAFLILRAVSLEFRSRVENPAWRRFWDGSFGIGSLVPSLLYGVAVGNVLRGIPLDREGAFTGTFVSLLNPYALLVGLVSLAMFLAHGAIYMALKSGGELCERMRKAALWLFVAWVALYAVATASTLRVAPHLIEGARARALFWPAVALLLAGLALVPVFLAAKRFLLALLSSSAAIGAMVALAGLGLLPRLVPSSIDLGHSLTIYNASSTPRTLTVMLVIALVGMPVVIAYTVFIYRVFKGKVALSKESY